MKLTNILLLAFTALTIANPIAEPNADAEAAAAAIADPNSELDKRVGEDCKVVRRFRPDLEGTCVDTRKPNCGGGTIYTNRCPGPSWNRCCIT